MQLFRKTGRIDRVKKQRGRPQLSKLNEEGEAPHAEEEKYGQEPPKALKFKAQPARTPFEISRVLTHPPRFFTTNPQQSSIEEVDAPVFDFSKYA